MSNSQNKIFIGNLPFKTDEDAIRQLFNNFGEILEVAIPKNRETGRPRGFAFVSFDTENSAKDAVSLHDTEVDGRQISVKIAENRESRGGSGGFNRGSRDHDSRQY